MHEIIQKYISFRANKIKIKHIIHIEKKPLNKQIVLISPILQYFERVKEIQE